MLALTFVALGVGAVLGVFGTLIWQRKGKAALQKEVQELRDKIKEML